LLQLLDFAYAGHDENYSGPRVREAVASVCNPGATTRRCGAEYRSRRTSDANEYLCRSEPACKYRSRWSSSRLFSWQSGCSVSSDVPRIPDSRTSLATTRGILRGAGLQGRLLAGEQGVLGAIRALTASNLLNRNDAINVGGQLAAEQVSQLQKLRELQLEDMTSKAAYQGYVIQRQASNEAVTVWFFSSAAARGDGRLFQPGLP
jgi:conjugal transfer/entry exclusion protein